MSESSKSTKELRRGDVVSVRSFEEILATLDGDFKLDGLPFMPEMTPHCGKAYRVFRRADKTCVEGLGIRSMTDTVFLEGLRCDGSMHNGCQRGCLFFWKESWLRPAKPTEARHAAGDLAKVSSEVTPCSPAAVAQLPTTKNDRAYCQSTELAGATSELDRGTLQLYLHDIRTGELSVRRLVYFVWMAVTNRVWRFWRGRTFYQIAGDQKTTARGELNLQPGELVEIKSAAEIQATLDERGRNRGLSFEPEMAMYCGRRFRVAGPITTIVAEETGKTIQLTNTVVLDGLVCKGICSKNCPRANYLYWREIWLKRV